MKETKVTFRHPRKYFYLAELFAELYFQDCSYYFSMIGLLFY